MPSYPSQPSYLFVVFAAFVSLRSLHIPYLRPKRQDPMKSLRSLPILFLSITLIACSGGGSNKEGDKNDGDKKMEQVQKLQKEVMKVHDKVMPKMSELQKLKGRAEGLRDSLADAGDTALASRMDKTVTSLEEGHHAMMHWMHQFEKPFVADQDTLKAAGTSEAIDYLKGQRKKVNAMADSVLNALEKARSRISDPKEILDPRSQIPDPRS